MENALVNVSNELTKIVRTVEPQIVSIRARRHYPSSGVLWNPGVVVTCDHTVHREEEIAVMFADGKSASAKLAGRDPGTDLAILKINGSSSAQQFARASGATPGELALVVGRSPDSGVNASLGIVSAASGPWRTWRGGKLDAYIRLDAKVFPQSSGAAVVNVRGELIGIATPALSRIAGLAIPASTVQTIAEKLLQRGFVPRAYLGVGAQQVPLSDELRKKLAVPNRAGLIVLAVEPAGPAEKAGILIGDVLIGVGENSIERNEDLQTFLDSSLIGKSVKVSYVRAGALNHTQLVVGERPGK